MKVLITGATGLTGSLLLRHLANIQDWEITCLVRPDSDRSLINSLNLSYIIGDSSTAETWERIAQNPLDTIVHIANIRHVPVILKSLATIGQTPRLIIIGTTGVYSQFNQYAAIYQDIESQISQYQGTYCLLRPTMIYGSSRDKNLHKLIKFCDRYGFFPVFGSGKCLLQPIHADDLAQAILATLQRPNVQGIYDLSGGSIVSFQDLLSLVETHLGKPVRRLYIPLPLGVGLAGIVEKILPKSPLRKEQILRLQEDKAYPHTLASQVLDFNPRSLLVGLQQEIQQLRDEGVI